MLELKVAILICFLELGSFMMPFHYLNLKGTPQTPQEDVTFKSWNILELEYINLLSK